MISRVSQIFAFFSFITAQYLGAQPVNLDWAAPTLGYDHAITEGIAVDDAGNLYHTGRFNGMMDFDPGPATFYMTSMDLTDMYISSVDSSGNFRWAKQIGGDENQWGIDITLDANANVIVTGIFEDSIDFDPGPGTFFMGSRGPAVSDKAFVLMLDSLGNFSWAKQFQGYGNPGASYGSSVVCDNANNIFLNVNYADTMVIDPGGLEDTLFTGTTNYNACILKLTSSGSIVWYKTFSGGYSELNALALDANSNIYATGKFYGTIDFDPDTGQTLLSSFTFYYDVFICRLDSSGNFHWVKQVGGPSDDIGYDVTPTPTGDLLITGDFRVNADFDPGPASYNYTASGTFDAFFLKLDSLGNFIWAKRIGGNPNAYMHSFAVATDAEGSMYTTGGFDYQMGGFDFDPGAGTFTITAVAYASFILKLDSMGTFIFAGQISGGPTSNANTESIVVDANETIYLGGLFGGTVDFDPSPLVANIYSQGAYVGFTCKLHQDYLNSSGEELLNNPLAIYPNPNNGTFTLQLNSADPVEVLIYDAQGKLVSTQKGLSNNSQITIAEPGMYMISMTTADGEQSSQRVIVKE